MKFVNTAILTLLLGVVMGITIAGFLVVSLPYVFAMSLGLLATLSVHLFLSLKNVKFRKFFVLHTFISAFVIGWFVAILHNPTSKSSHYTNQLAHNKPYLLQARVIEKLSESDFGISYKVKLLSSDNQEVTGDILCFFQKDILKRKLQRDESFVFLSELKEISPPKNPYQFDYKKYMERQGIFWRANVISYQLIENQPKVRSIQGFAENIREKIFDIFNVNFSKSTSSLLKTLLFGERSELDEDVYQHYIDSGAVHILAISGLHVGIITAILLFLLQKLPNMGIWKKLRLILLLLFLWSFALLAGLSPSVVRAVTMFSFVGISLMINRRQGRFDALMVSMFLLLLIHPDYLYDVGFQLSYGAVFSILVFYPRMEKWWQPKHKFFKSVWSLFIIGFSAQIVVLPISLYYFHQFPILFFVSNLLIVPLLSPVLILGFLAIILGIFNSIPYFLIVILENTINLMNFFAKIIANQEDFIVRNIYFDEILLVSSFFMIAAFIFWVNRQNFTRTIIFLGTILLFQATLFYKKYTSEILQNLVVFHTYKSSLFIVRNGKQLAVFQNDTVKNNYISNNYAKTLGISNISVENIPYLFEFQEKTILCLDSLGIYPTSENIHIDKVIIRQSPKINFERMLLKINPKIVIADGSNYPSFVKKWQIECQKLGIKFHSTAEKGAYEEKKSNFIGD